MQLEGQVGPATYADGVVQTIRLGKFGDVVASGLHGPYYEQTLRGNVFSYSNQSSNALLAQPATAVTGTQLVLSNNNGSGKNLVILWVGVGTTTAATTTNVVCLCGGWSATNVAHTTAGVPVGNLLGQTAGVGKVDIAATIPTTVPAGPVILMPLLSQGISAINPNISYTDIGGSIVVPPGGFLTFQTTGSTPCSALCAVCWEEVII